MYTFDPIGTVRSPFTEKAEAPRQPRAAEGVEGRLELVGGRGFEFALEDLEGWERLWVVFVFDRARDFKPKVQPPRSATKRGLFSTRSPHRPNPIGLSALRLIRVDGLTVHVSDLDLLDGTPILDIKPYVPYADAFPEATTGWLEEPTVAGKTPKDPGKLHEVELLPLARAQIEWLAERGVALESRLRTALELGAAPHPYRRIRAQGAGYTLSLKEWRVDFVVEGRRVTAERLRSGYRPKELYENEALQLHRDFQTTFGA